MSGSLLPRMLVGLALCLAPSCGPGADDVASAPDADRAVPDRRAAARPHVVLVSVDTLRADHLGCYGYERPTSPHIDGLARGGVLFTEAFSQAPCTAPSHMSLMTGLYPEAHGVKQWRPAPAHNERLHDDVPTLASQLRAAGYRTVAHTGGGNVRPELGFDQGFDEYVTHGNDVRAVFDAGLLELRAQASDPAQRPLLLFVHTFETHDPYLPPERLAGLYADSAYRGRMVSSDEELQSWPYYRPELRSKLFWHLVDESDTSDVQRLRDLYDACIHHVDGHVGRLLAGLERLGLDDETLVIFTSDHGEEFQEHGGFTHDTQFQELLHVPLIMRPPPALVSGLELPTRVAGPVRSIDVLPTVLDLLQLPALPGLPGRSLVPSMRAGRSSDEPLVFSQWPRGNYHALRVGDWKYIRKHAHFDTTVLENPVEVELLYDLATDPGETTDLSASHPDVLLTLRARMAALRAASRAQHDALGPGREVELDEATQRLLEGMGYLGR